MNRIANDARVKKFHLSLLGALILGVTLVTGCFDSEDIDRRMIVSSVGIDAYPGGRIRVAFRMPLVAYGGKEQGNGPSEKPFILHSALAQGVFPGLIDIQDRDEHGIFIGQCGAVVFGEALARKGLKPVLDFFSRMPTFPPNAFVVIARPTALDLLNIDWPERETHDQNIRSFFTNQANQIFGIKKWALFRDINDPLEDPVVPLVASSDENTDMKLLGLAVFRDDQMVGALDAEETRLLGILKNTNKENRLIIPIRNTIPVTFLVAKGKKKLKVFYHDHPVFHLSLNINAFIGELGGYRTPLDRRQLRQLEVKVALYLKKKYLALFHKLQAFHSDPIDLGNYYRIQQPKHFSLSHWPKEYRHAEFQVQVKVFVDRLGVLK